MNEYFSLQLPLFKTKDGKFDIPENTNKIWFDIYIF